MSLALDLPDLLSLQDGLRKEEGRVPFFWEPCKCNLSLCCDAYLEVEAEGGAEEVLRLLKENRDTDVFF